MFVDSLCHCVEGEGETGRGRQEGRKRGKERRRKGRRGEERRKEKRHTRIKHEKFVTKKYLASWLADMIKRFFIEFCIFEF